MNRVRLNKSDDIRGYRYGMPQRDGRLKNRLMIGVPMTGLLRAEWVLTRYGQVIPCNWSQSDCIQFIDQYSPLNFLVADARNVVVDRAVREDFEWLLFIDHDTIIPPNFFVVVNERMLAKNPIPIWSGLYFTKSMPSEPLIYRGIGTGYYNDWKFGDEVWVDGIPMGCTLIHCSILKVMHEEAEEYQVAGRTLKKVFETPSKVWYDPQQAGWMSSVGTEDLKFCNDVINNNIFKKAGWNEYAKKKYPFMVDTKIFCKHIDEAGVQYPCNGEELAFMPNQITKKVKGGKCK